MALASYIISFALGMSSSLYLLFISYFLFFLGIISIDMFCDHYSLISPSLTPTQFNTCTSYYQNVFYQPWYTSLVTLLPISIGAIILIRNIKRTIYDTLSIPLFLAVVGLFLRIKKNIELLTVETQANNSAKEGYLKAIAYDHATIGVLLILLLILQVLAGKKAKIPVKKNL
jgi:hypothetical protein